MSEVPRRRRRIRSREPGPVPVSSADQPRPVAPDPDRTPEDLRATNPERPTGRPGRDERRGDTAAPVPRPPAWVQPAGADADRDENDRGLRSLVGNGTSQVGVRAAMLARDAARPTDADVAAAETQLVIIRRGWVPRD